MIDLVRRLIPIFSPGTKRRLRWAVVGSIGIAFADMAGLLALMPLMQMLTGASPETGMLGWLSTVLGNPSDGTLAVILASVVFGAFVTKGALTIVFRWWLIGFIKAQEAETATTLLRRYLAAPYWLHLQRNTADLVRTMNEAVSQTYSNVVVGLVSAVTEAATIIGVVLVLVVLMPVPAVFAVAYFGVTSYAFYRVVKPRVSAAGEIQMSASFETYQAAFHALGGVKEIKVRRNAAHFVTEYQTARQRFAAATRTASFLVELPRYILEIVFIVGVALMSAVAFASDSSTAALTALALFVAAGFRLLPSLVRLNASLNGVRVGRRGVELVLADLAEINGSDDEESVLGPPLVLSRRIHVDHVSFHYPGTDVAVLRGVTFDILAGQSVAIVGASGAGKSTLVDLLLGLHQPTQGRIVVDDTDIDDALPQWQRSIGVVPQDVYLLDDSLRANVAFGERREEINPERITEAIGLTQLDELVDALPEGLDTYVGERGVRLSGGQRQRIGIARALYLRPQLLVLDEATSALDNDTERRITSTVESLQGKMTIVVVAHRLSTVRNCDQLVFLKDGVVEAVGTFDEVRSASAAFASLVELGNLGVLDAGSNGSTDLESPIVVAT